MTPKQKIELRQTEVRAKLRDLAAVEELTDEQRAEIATLTGEAKDLDTRLAAAILAEGDPPEATPEERASDDGESRELRELRSKVTVGGYVSAAIGERAPGGPEGDYNAALGLPVLQDGVSFPTALLAEGVEVEARAPVEGGEVEHRGKVDGDTRTGAASWLDRVFHQSAAQRLGITFRSVPAGTTSYPVLTGGQASKQRGREEAVSGNTYTIAVSELKPTRNAAQLAFTVEDAARMPGLEEALTRDLRSAVVESLDGAIFKGDDGANEDTADLTGLTTYTGITEITITQAQKVKADETLKKLAALIDGAYATGLGDLRIVTTEGANALWLGTIHNSAVSNQTIAQFLRDSGVSWSVKGDVETDTANGDFGAFIGLSRGIAGAAVAPVWESARIIRDPYTGAGKGEVTLTIETLWNFGLPRTANFRRVKFVT